MKTEYVVISRSHPYFNYGEIISVSVWAAKIFKLKGKRAGDRNEYDLESTDVYPVSEISNYFELEKLLDINNSWGRPSVAEVFNKKIKTFSNE